MCSFVQTYPCLSQFSTLPPSCCKKPLSRKNLTHRPLTKPSLQVTRHPQSCASRPNSSSQSYSSSSDVLTLPLLTIPTDTTLPTPGETCFIDVPIAILRQLQQTSLHDLALTSSSFLNTRPRGDSTTSTDSDSNSDINLPSVGLLIKILRLDPVVNGSAEAIRAECRCPSRLLITSITTDNNYATTMPFFDTPVVVHSERVELAKLEWTVWTQLVDNSQLRTRLSTDENNSDSNRPYGNHAKVWAPKDYDKRIIENEWDATPFVTRRVWWRRAESFSFAVVRAVSPSSFKHVISLTTTMDRLQVALQCLSEEKSKIHAKISLKDALG